MIEIYPAILTHTIEEYSQKLAEIEAGQAGFAHIDIMDGQFVPNITVMPHEIMSFSTPLKLEAHLMTFRPERYFSDLTVAGVSRVLLHREVYETLEECTEAIAHAADYFPEVGLVINPDTKVEPYHELKIASIQCMGVHPGASGQPFLPEAMTTIKEVIEQKMPVVVAVDGGVGEDNLARLKKVGVTRFVINEHHFSASNMAESIRYFTKLAVGEDL